MIQVSVRRSSLPLAVILACLALATGAVDGAAPGGRARLASDPLLDALAAEDYATARPQIERALRSAQEPVCQVLGSFAAQRDERVRENAVRSMIDSGCRHLGDYRPYLDDTSPWVAGVVVSAIERHLMVEAVPYLIDRLGDRRTVISGEGSWTIAEAAHRALRAVTCQSFHFDPQGSARGQREAIEAWRAWYAAHQVEAREAWVAAGIALARDYISRDYPPHRVEGYQLLALIGAPGLAALRAALDRKEGDLRARLACTLDEPPRVTDEIPCILEVVNVSGRRLAFAPAPGPPDVSLTRQTEAVAAPRDPGPRPGKPSRKDGSVGRGTKSEVPPEPGPPLRPTAPSPPPAVDPVAVANALVDLAPGETVRREFKVGPVPAAGRYEVRTEIRDLSLRLRSPDGAASSPSSGPSPGSRSAAPAKAAKPAPPPPPIVASVVIRFEQ